MRHCAEKYSHTIDVIAIIVDTSCLFLWRDEIKV